MSTERKGTELFVGLFLVIGFAVIAVMVVMFGRVGQSFTKTYEITVEFPNASGLVKNADVLLAGARIGNVAEAPYLLVKDGFSVGVTLKINEKVRIPRDATIVVNQSGLLGDCYVDVLPPDRIDPNNLIMANDHVIGRNKPGLDVLQAKGADVLEKLASELDELEALTKNINQNLVNEQNTKNLQETFAHLKTMSSNLSDSSKKLDGILVKGDTAVDSAKRTMETVDKAAADLRTAMSDFKRVSQNANNTLDSAKNMMETGNRVLKKAEQGEGALGLLLSDKETAENLKSFATNLRRSGPVFYKDRGVTPAPAAPGPRRR
jgi:phospholipid/cholesterol/gamma-HCH transport system substrate-binding protein